MGPPRIISASIPEKTIGIWGLSFKPNTDDVRSSPPIEIINLLLKKNARIKVFDPVAMDKAKGELFNKVEYCKDIYEVAKKIIEPILYILFILLINYCVIFFFNFIFSFSLFLFF